MLRRWSNLLNDLIHFLHQTLHLFCDVLMVVSAHYFLHFQWRIPRSIGVILLWQSAEPLFSSLFGWQLGREFEAQALHGIPCGLILNIINYIKPLLLQHRVNPCFLWAFYDKVVLINGVFGLLIARIGVRRLFGIGWQEGSLIYAIVLTFLLNGVIFVFLH